MPKKFGVVFVAMGAVLILSALLLFTYNMMEDRQAGQNAEVVVSGLQSIMDQVTAPSKRGVDTSDPDHPEETEPEEWETISDEHPALIPFVRREEFEVGFGEFRNVIRPYGPL